MIGSVTWVPPTSGPLLGVTVIDFSQAAAGPFCAQHLGDMGAEVIKVEPVGGDMLRGVDARAGSDVGTYFMGLNRNKRSVAVDLTTQAGREIATQLCLRADVVVENYRPGTMARLGLDYESLRHANPRLVYTSITAFGESGPLRGRPGMDIIVQAFAGLMGVTGSEDDAPVKVGAPVADLATGYAAAMGTLAALFERERSGEGQRVTLSMLNVVTSLLSNVATGHLMHGEEVPRMGSAHPQLVPYQAFQGSDGDFIVIGVLNERFWVKFCTMIGDDALATSEAFARNADRVRNRQGLLELLAPIFRARAVADWEHLCEQHDVPYARVNRLRDLFGHPQAVEQGLVVTLPSEHSGDIPTVAQPSRFSRTPASYHAPPPKLGAHTEAVLQECGYTPEQLRGWRRTGVIGTL